jgi:hypothetical protein
MNVSIIGCEFFNDYQVLKWKLDELNATQITTCGNGSIERFAERYAGENSIQLSNLWPENDISKVSLWKEYYKLLVSSNVLLAFWFGEPNRVSSMIKKAELMKKEVIVIHGYHQDPSNSPMPLSVPRSTR